MRNLMKKIPLPVAIGIAAVLILAIVLICIFAGKETQPEEIVIPSQGSVVINMGGIVQIDYDISGNVLELEALNSVGSIILEQVDNYAGTSTFDLVARLLTIADNENFMENLIILMQVAGAEPEQSTDFLSGLRNHILDKAGDGHNVVLLTIEDLTEEGQINFNAAQGLLKQYLGNKKVEISATEEIRHDCYGMYAILGESATFYQVNCITGEISKSNSFEFYGGEEETFPSEPEETMPDYVTDPDYLDPDMFYGNVDETDPVEEALPTEETTQPTEETVA